MAVVPVVLKENALCGYCGAEVEKGRSVCKNCGAVYGYDDDPLKIKEKSPFTCLFAVFLLGLLMTAAYVAIIYDSFLYFLLLAVVGISAVYGIDRAVRKKAEKKLLWWH